MSLVLYVDDESSLFLNPFVDAIQEAGYEVHTARDAQEAKNAIEEKKPDIIVLDLLLPNEYGVFGITNKEEAGIEIHEFIRKKKGLRLPIIFLTVVAEDDPLLSGVKKAERQALGKDAVIITKPAFPSDVVEAINNALRGEGEK